VVLLESQDKITKNLRKIEKNLSFQNQLRSCDWVLFLLRKTQKPPPKKDNTFYKFWAISLFSQYKKSLVT